MLAKLIMHLIHFISAILICSIALVFCGSNKAVAVWNAVLEMDKEISDGGENKEVLD